MISIYRLVLMYSTLLPSLWILEQGQFSNMAVVPLHQAMMIIRLLSLPMNDHCITPVPGFCQTYTYYDRCIQCRYQHEVCVCRGYSSFPSQLSSLHYTTHYYTPFIIMSFQNFPAELKVEVMTQLGSLHTLRNVLTAMPSLIPLFNVRFYGITKELLKTAFTPQLHSYIYAILQVHLFDRPRTVNELESFFTKFFDRNGKEVNISQFSLLPPLSASYEDILKPLDYMIKLSFAVKYFETYASKTVKKSRDSERDLRPAEKWELRIVRVLLRLQLHAEVFDDDAQPTAKGGEVSKMDRSFWSRYSTTYYKDSKLISTMLDRWARLRTSHSYKDSFICSANDGQYRGLVHTFMMMDSNRVSTAGLDYIFKVMKESVFLRGERSPNKMTKLVARFEIDSFFHGAKRYEKLSQEI